jgi:hypothetical protein
MFVNTLFQGSDLDIYVHWLILWLGIGIFILGVAIFFSCRSVSSALNLTGTPTTWGARIYHVFSRYHSYYWVAFWMILVLHLMVTITHIGLPVAGEPYFRAQQVTLYSAIANLILMLIIFTSCRSFTSLAALFTSGNILSNITYKRFFRLHALFWGLLGASIIIHIVSGIVHAINT